MEHSSDQNTIREIHLRAFGRKEEADLVDALRAAGHATLSLLAETQRTVVGHLLFSPAHLENSPLKILGLAPVAVLPKFQNRGIGSLLIQEGLRQSKEQGHAAIVVLGNPSFYTRFGFQPASHFGIQPPGPHIPVEAFMVLELQPKALAQSDGLTIHYAPEFDKQLR